MKNIFYNGLLGTHLCLETHQAFLREHFLHGLDAQFDERRAAAAFVLRGFGDRGYVGMLLQHLAEGFAEDAHTTAMDYADAWQPGQEGAVNELFDFAARDVDSLADHVNFHRYVEALALELH